MTHPAFQNQSVENLAFWVSCQYVPELPSTFFNVIAHQNRLHTVFYGFTALAHLTTFKTSGANVLKTCKLLKWLLCSEKKKKWNKVEPTFYTVSTSSGNILCSFHLILRCPVAMVYNNLIRIHCKIQSRGRSIWKKNNNVHINPTWIKIFIAGMKVS